MSNNKNIFNYDENMAVLDEEEPKQPNEKPEKVIDNEVKNIIKEVVDNVDKKIKENNDKDLLDDVIETDPFFFS